MATRDETSMLYARMLRVFEICYNVYTLVGARFKGPISKPDP